MTILDLQIENYKRLKAVNITPKGNVVVIASKKNGEGKSSVLDGIWSALGGKDAVPPEPIRRGEDRAEVNMTLGTLDFVDFKVKWVATHASQYLTVTPGDGKTKLKSPQAVLDALVGRLAFDPLEFTRLKTREQADAVKLALGIAGKLGTLAESREKLYATRTIAGREADSLRARFAALPVPVPGLPTEEVSTADAVTRLREAALANVQLQKDAMEHASTALYRATLVSKIAEAETQLATLKSDLKAYVELERNGEAKLAGRLQIDLAPLEKAVNEAETINRSVKAAKDRAALETELATKAGAHEALDGEIKKLDAEVLETYRSAKFPIEELTFSPEGTLQFNGTPFEQASTAEKLCVSATLGLALNPKLKIMFIRDGSLLDDDSMAFLDRLAAHHKAQIWVERVGVEGEVGIIIEDGEVKL